MENLIYCPKYKLKVNPEMEENCKGCIFNKQKLDEDEKVYLICDFENWKPGLKRGKEC